jgi:hypothetical protein
MAGTGRWPILPPMHGTPITLTVEVHVSGDFLSGRARDATGRWREFSGRLGLMGAIDALVAARTGDAPEGAAPSPRATPLETKETDR